MFLRDRFRMPCKQRTLSMQVVTSSARSSKIVRFDFEGARNVHAYVRYVYINGFNFERHSYTSKNRSLKFQKLSQCDNFCHMYLQANRQTLAPG